MQIIREIEKQYMKDELPEFSVGDTVDVHVKIREGEKERIQIFNGTVIRRKGSSVRETFTVRRIVQGEGVERIFPIHSPNVVDVVVKKRGRVRRARLYYLRKRVGKGVRVREKLWVKAKTQQVDTAEATEAEAARPPASTPEEAARKAEARKADARSQKKKASADRAGKKRAKLEKRKQAKQAKAKQKAAAREPEEKKGD